MAAPLRIVAFSGSLRARSFNTALLNAAVEQAPEGLDIDVRSLRDIPLFDDDVRSAGIPAPVMDLTERVNAADGVLIASPEYNHGVPGVLKNALDWISVGIPGAVALRHKPIGLMGASIGLLGTVRAQLALRQSFLFTTSYAMQKPEIYVTFAPSKFDDALRLVDEDTRALLGEFMTSYAAFVGWMKDNEPPTWLPTYFGGGSK